jgi:hypothetical protein
MAESKVQKVARHGAAQAAAGTCACGGALVWTKLMLTRGRMVKACLQCGAIEEQPRS